MRYTVVFLVLSGLALLVPVQGVAQDAGMGSDVTVSAPADVSAPAAISPEVIPAAEVSTVQGGAEDPSSMFDGASAAFAGGQWAVLTGFLLMLLTWAVKRASPVIPAIAVPWMPMCLSMVGYMGHALIMGGDWKQAVMHGFMAGASAVGLWELVFQHFMPKKAA